jgi:hypothetical protein
MPSKSDQGNTRPNLHCDAGVRVGRQSGFYLSTSERELNQKQDSGTGWIRRFGNLAGNIQKKLENTEVIHSQPDLIKPNVLFSSPTLAYTFFFSSCLFQSDLLSRLA